MRLQANKYEIVQASDGYSAIAVAQREQPNLIILDLGLPAGDGYAVLERLQQSYALSGIPVIVVTASDTKSNRQKAMQSGATAFFQKPLDSAELLHMIRATLPDAPVPETHLF